MKHIVRLLALLAFITSASAQFTPGRFWLGPSFAVALPGGAFGGGVQGEYAINENFGAGLEIGYYSYRDETITDLPAPFDDIVLSNRYATISALAFGTYHFMPGKEIDPFAKIGLGYKTVDLSMERNGTSLPVPAGFSAATASGFDYLIQAGARYHFSEGFSARAAVGYPVIFSLGLDLATGGKSSSPDVVVDDSARKKARANQYSLYVGPYIMGKASLKSEVAEGWKTGIVFNVPPDFGASILVPFGKHINVGFGLDFGLSFFSYQFKPESNPTDSNTLIARYEYTNVFPHFNLGGFIIGMNFGFANASTTKSVLDSAASIVGQFDTTTFQGKTTYFPDNPKAGYNPAQYMASMMEVRIGGSIPVVTSDFGRLNVLIQAGYSLSGLFDDYRNYEGSYPIDGNQPPGVRIRTQPQESLNPHFISFAVGLCYYFRLGF